jgi:hypothetical protein
MAADIPGQREAAESLAECPEDLVNNGHYADALDWFSCIVEGGQLEMGPHAALRMGHSWSTGTWRRLGRPCAMRPTTGTAGLLRWRGRTSKPWPAAASALERYRNRGRGRRTLRGGTAGLRQRLPGHPGRYSLPRSVADRTDHRARHRRVYVPGSGDSLPAELQLVLGRNSPYISLAI